ncbi:MAG: transporter [Bacteroidetes bacterium MED-G13]|nr:MAG: transporter [Bacteroidetes bacterium MED-G13]|tara:strand:+ start:38020 stop:39339 length:1320 start_codon:yes stop_codon:yes gene_type:complete
MKKFIKVFLLSLFFSINFYAQKELTISEAIEATLKNNFDIKISKNIEKISKNNTSILNNNYLPLIQIGSELNNITQNIEIETPNGISGTLNDTKTDNNSAILSFNYNLIDSNGRKYNYQKSKELYSKTKLEVRDIIENTVLQLYSIYFELSRLAEQHKIIIKSLDISKKRLERKLLEFEYGQSNNLEVLNAEVDMNNDSIRLLNTMKKLVNAKSDLNLIMNYQSTDNYLTNTDFKFLSRSELSKLYSNGINNNTTFLIQEKEVVISNINQKITRFSYLPTIGLIGSYGWNESINDNPYAFYNKSISDGFSAGINLRWDVFRGGKKIIANKNSKLSIENSKILKESTILKLKNELKNAYDTHFNNLYILAVQKKNVVTNMNNFERNLEKYNIGTISSIEFRRAQLNLLNANLEYNSAKYQTKLSEAFFLKICGEILNYDY